MTVFAPASPAEREVATMFAGRIAQLDQGALIRLIAVGPQVHMWAKAGFGVLATRAVAGRIAPSPLTVYAANLTGALAVSREAEVDPGRDVGDQWTSRLPAADAWLDVGALDPAQVAERVRSALPAARTAVEHEREHELAAATKATVPPALLDSVLLSVPTAGGLVPISMRMLFALSGMGFAAARPEAGARDAIRVRTTATWLRLDAADGSVARRRMPDLPLT